MSEIAFLSPEALFAALALLTPRAAALCLQLLPSQQLLPPARLSLSDMLRRQASGALPLSRPDAEGLPDFLALQMPSRSSDPDHRLAHRFVARACATFRAM